MFFIQLSVLITLSATSSGDIPDTSVQNCVYTFTVPPTEDMCPPGSKDSSNEDVQSLKQTIERQFLDITNQLQNLTQLLVECTGSQQKQGDGVDGQPSGVKSGTHYTRWGHSECPQTAELLYTGYAAKGRHNHGGGVDYQCLPSEPDFAVGAVSGTQSQSYIYGVEYERQNSPVIPGDRHDNDAPCAVCHVNDRGEQLMIPAKLTCPTGWTQEYEGLLMAQHHTQKGSTFACVDKEMEPLPGGQSGVGGGLFYVVEARCGSLPCPPYQDGVELPCVVCTL